MSYAPTKLRVPPGFEHLLEGLTREILRSQPKDIIAFSAEYFRKKIVLRDGKALHSLRALEELVSVWYNCVQNRARERLQSKRSCFSQGERSAVLPLTTL